MKIFNFPTINKITKTIYHVNKFRKATKNV